MGDLFQKQWDPSSMCLPHLLHNTHRGLILSHHLFPAWEKQWGHGLRVRLSGPSSTASCLSFLTFKMEVIMIT